MFEKNGTYNQYDFDLNSGSIRKGQRAEISSLNVKE